jgi:hypothetical protein
MKPTVQFNSNFKSDGVVTTSCPADIFELLVVCGMRVAVNIRDNAGENKSQSLVTLKKKS